MYKRLEIEIKIKILDITIKYIQKLGSAWTQYVADPTQLYPSRKIRYHNSPRVKKANE